MEDPSALFRSAVGDAKPIKHDRIAPAKPNRRPVPRSPSSDDARSAQNNLSDHIPWTMPEDGENADFLRNGISRETLRRLRRGHWPAQEQLDLHGLTSDEARNYLVEFLEMCKQRGLRTIRVVHGKGLRSPNGEPVLKQKVRHWLTQREEVLAYTQANPAEGGSGALLVLLKSTAEKD